MKIVVDIHGVEKEISVLVDTGFTSETGYGLQLPSSYANYAISTGTGYVMVADGREVAAASIPDAKIVQIDTHRLKHAIPIPALFMGGPDGTVGVLILQRMSASFDGPKKVVTLTF